MATSQSTNQQIAQFIADVGIAHEIVHGGPETIVATEGGPVRSFANVIAGLDADLDAAADSVVGQVFTARDVAVAAGNSAAASATAAGNSASSASTNAATAVTSATNASASATAADASADDAAASQLAASNSAASSIAAKDLAQSAATTASTAATTATTAATTATNQATQANANATSAATSATNAAASATAAGTSATAAQTAATTAQTAATTAQAAATAAAASETAAEAAQAAAEAAAASVGDASEAAAIATTKAAEAAASATSASTSASASQTARLAAEAAVASIESVAEEAAQAIAAAAAAEASAASADDDRNAAELYAAQAAASAIDANTAKVAAELAASSVEDITEIAQGAIDAAAAAATSQDAAAWSAVNANSSATAAGTAATNASSSATAAANSSSTANNARIAAEAAAESASDSSSDAAAAVVSCTSAVAAAGGSATAAAASQTAAATSATTATTAATNAGNSATAAATSATAAATSATTANTKATEATTSATNAAASATAAAGSATTASTAATTATTKATEASTSATNAATSATNAAGSATTASGHATTATGAATTATTKASEASASASASQTSRLAAEAAQAAAEAAASGAAGDGFVNIMNYMPGGQTNLALAIAAAITAGKNRLRLPVNPAGYDFSGYSDSTLTSDTVIDFNGQEIRFATGGRMQLKGAVVASGRTLASNAARYTKSVTLNSGASVQRGDICYIHTTIEPSDWPDTKKDCVLIGEIAGAVATLAAGLNFHYNTADAGLAVTIYRPVKLTLLNANLKLMAAQGDTATNVAIFCEGLRDIQIVNAKISGIYPFNRDTNIFRSGIWLYRCWGAFIYSANYEAISYPIGVYGGTRFVTEIGARATYTHHSHSDCGDWSSDYRLIGLDSTFSYQALSTHPCFRATATDVNVRNDFGLSNWRCAGGSLSRVRVDTSATDAMEFPQFQNLVPKPGYEYINQDADFFVHDVEIDAPARATKPAFGVRFGRYVDYTKLVVRSAASVLLGFEPGGVSHGIIGPGCRFTAANSPVPAQGLMFPATLRIDGKADYVPVVNANTTLTLPIGFDVVQVNGTTPIIDIATTGQAGRRVTLYFSGVCPVHDMGGNVDIEGTPGTINPKMLDMFCDGTYWRVTRYRL